MDSFNFALPSKPKLPTSGRTGRSGSLGSGGRRFLSDVDSSPVSWRQYWTTCQDVKIPVESASSSSSGGSSSSSNEDVFRVYRRGSDGPLIVMLHGGGYSALTWSLVVEEVCNEVQQCQVLAFDQRGHGSTRTVRTEDLDADTLARDVGRVLRAVFGDGGEASIPGPVVLVGHSLGGAIAVHAEFHKHIDVAVAGVIVIDVVEGTALAALSSMHSVLAARPLTFPSLQEAVLWSYRSGQTRNLDAARVSMPGQVKNVITNVCGADEVEQLQQRKNSEICASDAAAVATGAGDSAAVSTDSTAAPADADAATKQGRDESQESSLLKVGPPPISAGSVRFSARRLSCRRLSVDNENKIEEEAEEEEEDDSDNTGKKDDKKHIDADERRKKQMHNEEFRKSFESKRLKQSSLAGCSSSSIDSGVSYTWSINLSSTTDHWNGWFEGLSQNFLSITPPKLLLLAGVDRLDTDLTVGQMQGKFQMQVVGRCGHAVHEDAPDEVAAAIIAFLTRHRILQPKHPSRYHTLPGC
uniref:protein phosphatase methylesterase-1 n=2 Tax=Hirondellea gigas TaxID=1518452 RepID=A0A6A7G343_9CRUS